MRTLELIESVGRERFHCDILLDSGQEAELDPQARQLGCRLWYFPRGPRFGARLRGLLRAEHYGVVHSHVGYTSGALVAHAESAGVPVRIAHLHNSRLSASLSLPRRARASWMRTLIQRHATDIVAVSRGTLESAWRSDWASDPRCRVVYDGLDVTPYAQPVDPAAVRADLGLEPTAPLLVHVGRVHPQKNYEWVVEVFAAVAAERPAARLALVGDADGPAGEPVRARIDQLGIRSAVILTGIRNDVPRLLGSADLLLFPSRWEGLPGVVLEACAAGLPVLASEIPGVPEIAEHFPSVHTLPLSAPAACWAERVCALLDAGRPAEPGWRSWDRTPFSIEACARAMAALWERAGEARDV